ncbi:MAG: hypothetical protein Phog2KO_10990 [Phototrophicaceae bacterium]
MKKAVSDMTSQEYLDYLNELPEQEFMNVVAHDVKKVVSIAHGYISLLRLDIEEGILDPAQVQDYISEMESMLEKSYIYIEQAEDSYRTRINS